MANIEAGKDEKRLTKRLGGAAAATAGILLLIALISRVAGVCHLEAVRGRLSPLQNNWLNVIYEMLAGQGGVQSDRLHGLKLLDIVILALVGMMSLGLYFILKKTSRIWSLIALLQPFIGIGIFLVTRTAGRSTVMSTVLTVSIIMLWSPIFKKAIAYSGIVASVLLLVGDFTAGSLHSSFLAFLFGVGYVMLMTWFFLVAWKLFRLGRAS